MSYLNKILSRIARNSDWYNNVVFQDCSKFWGIRDYNIDVVNLGSNSAKYGFDYSECEVVGRNWAMGPQSLMMDLNIIQCYYSFLKPGATVLIPLCPFSCLVGYDYSYFSDKYYTVLGHSQIPCFNIHKRVTMNDMKLNPYRYIPVIEFVKTLTSKLKFRQRKKAIVVDFDKDSERFINSWKSQFFIKDFDDEWSLLNQNSYIESKEILYKIVDFCTRYGLKPVIVMPPVSSSLKKCFSDDTIKRCVTNYVKEAVGGDVKFLNYFDDKRFNDNALFSNSYFLNSIGAKLFTKTVLKDLNI